MLKDSSWFKFCFNSLILSINIQKNVTKLEKIAILENSFLFLGGKDPAGTWNPDPY